MSKVSLLEMFEQLSAKEKEHIKSYLEFLHHQAAKRQGNSDELNQEDLKNKKRPNSHL